MSNNIYNILGKLNSLVPTETPKSVEPQKPIYESVEARGSVLEGVAKVESRLAKMFAEENANEDMLSAKQKKIAKMSPPANKIDANDLKALRAGKKQKEEGNEFSGELAKAKAQHKDSFTVGGKEYPVKEDTHGQWLKKKESEAKDSGKSSFQAFKQTHDVKGGAAKEVEEETTEESLEEGFEDLQKYMADKAKGAKQGGGAGKKQGTRYGGSAQKDDEGDEEVSDTPKKKGRPKKDKFAEAVMEKAVSKQQQKFMGMVYAAKKGEKPASKDVAKAASGMSKKAAKDFAGTKHKGLPQKVSESVLTESTLARIAHQYSKEVKDFMAGGNMDDDLFSALYDYYFDDMPYGTKKARDGDPYEWVADRFHKDMGGNDVNEVVAPAMEAPMAESGAFHPGRVVYWRGKAGTVDRVEGDKCFVNKPNGEMDVWPTKECSTEKQGMLDTLKKDAIGMGQGIKNFVMNKPEPMDEELNELAKLAGLSEAKKCNHTMEGEKCPVHGLKECGSGMYESAKPDYIDLDKDGDKEESMKDAAKDAEQVDEAGDLIKGIKRFVKGKDSPETVLNKYGDKVSKADDLGSLGDAASRYAKIQKVVDKNLSECGMSGPMGQDEGNMSINTSMNSDGTKSVSVNATGNQADALAQMLKMAGLAAHQAMHGGGEVSAEEPKAIVIQAGPDEQVEEERDVQYANTPDEEVENVDAIMHQGNDLNREKEQYAGMPKAGDNPMATRESIEMPKSISKMLEGIKLVDTK